MVSQCGHMLCRDAARLVALAAIQCALLIRSVNCQEAARTCRQRHAALVCGQNFAYVKQVEYNATERMYVGVSALCLNL